MPAAFFEKDNLKEIGVVDFPFQIVVPNLIEGQDIQQEIYAAFGFMEF